MTAERPVIITPGDPAGIGPEITLRALHEKPEWRDKVIVIGDREQLTKLADSLSLPLNFTSWTTDELLSDKHINLLDISWPETVIAGKADSRNAPKVIEAIKDAVLLCQNGDVAGMVTCPIAKSVLYEAGFDHPGHTEFLGSLSQNGKAPVMMLANPELKVVPATIHTALRKVPEQLSINGLSIIFEDVAMALRDDFGIAKPHIAICGLNPHAGENGALGDEEQTIIIPAIEQTQKKLGNDVIFTGPHAADSLFHREKLSSYDCVIGMYHDQVLIPVKTIDFHRGVNITLGVDFIRTSPDHGTAFDIAGRGVARADSLIAAISFAMMMAQMKAGTS